MFTPHCSVLFLPALLLSALPGCAVPGPNPSFPLTVPAAEAELAAMRASPKPLARPVVVIDGYLGVGLSPAVVAGRLREVTTDGSDVITLALLWCTDFDACREAVIAAVDRAFPSADPAWTREVDVIGISMGGLAARYAAADPDEATPVALASADAGPVTRPAATAATPAPPSPPPAAAKPPVRRLKIARLFTLATPHRGASAVFIPSPVPLQRDMRAGSTFLARLDALRGAGDVAGSAYPIVPYGRVPDGVVGAANTAPPGSESIWVPTGFMEAGHMGIAWDPRIVADVARRLRGEPSYAVEPRVPVPE